MESPEESSWRTGLEFEPTKFQSPEAGPIEKRIRKLEDMVWSLLDKLPKGPPIDPKDFPPVREGHDCEKAHPEQSHKEWEKSQEKK